MSERNISIPKSNTDLKAWSLYYAQLGFAVFPLQPRGKVPFLDGGFKIASKDPDQIATWWTRWPDANIGIATGAASGGLVVIDADVNPDAGYDGTDSLREYAAAHGPFPDTCRALTGRGGFHDFYRTTETLHNRAGVLEGVDVRADGGYVVAAPSIHPNGRRYTWEIDPEDAEIAEANDAVLELCRSHKPGTGRSEATKEDQLAPIMPGTRNDTIYRLACSLQAKGLTDEAIRAAVMAENKNRCVPPMGEAEIERIIANAIRQPKGTHAITTQHDRPEDHKDQYRPDDLSEAGAAEVFALTYGPGMRWTKSLGWMVWDGKRWCQNDALAKNRAMQYTSDMLTEAKKMHAASTMADDNGEASPDAKLYLKFAQRMRNTRPIENILALAQARMITEAAIFDASPFDLNTPSGIIDLRTGTMRPSSPSAYCSKMTTVTPSNDGAYLWQDFLNVITDGDESLQRFLQISAGSCAIGKVFHEGLQIAIGAGRNGKSTFYNALAAVLGDYSGTLHVNTLTMERGGNKGAALATLRGKRLVITAELEEGARLSTQTLKMLASTDMLTIEEKYRSPETIKPTHHVVMFSNHLPRVGSTDLGTWRRLLLIPFQTTIPAGSDKPNYADKLVKEAGGAILDWTIQGARMFFEDGCRLEPPAVVLEATARYRQQEDWLQNFIDECCRVMKTPGEGPRLIVGVGKLYEVYKSYADATGTYRRSMPDFNRAMENAGFEKRTVRGGFKCWEKIDLIYERYAEDQLADNNDDGEAGES